MKLFAPNYLVLAFAVSGVCMLCIGCFEQHSAAPTTTSGNSDFASPEDAMFALVSQEAVYHVLRNVDRPLDTEFTKPVIHIPPDDPTIANVAVYCTFTENSRKVKRLFFVMFENNKSPEFASKKEDLNCLLVNADGRVLDRDDEYWSGLPQEAQQQSGAVDGEAPPFIARTMLEIKGL